MITRFNIALDSCAQKPVLDQQLVLREIAKRALQRFTERASRGHTRAKILETGNQHRCLPQNTSGQPRYSIGTDELDAGAARDASGRGIIP